MSILESLAFVCPMLFIAGIVDGIAGGGGLIALPAYVMTGMPIHFAYGCNKLQSGVGTTISACRYLKSGMVDLKIAIPSALVAILSSFAATRIVLILDDKFLNNMMLVLLPVIAVVMLVKKGKAQEKMSVAIDKRTIALAALIGLILGFYDGMFGPGGGTIAMILFSLVLKYDTRVACGNGKIVILVSNYIALISYIISGNILYQIAIPAAVCNALGSYVGAGLAIQKGRKIMLPVMSVVIILLAVQIIIK